MSYERLEELLLTVQKPGRYVGGEWNSVAKEWTPGRVKVALAFPDTYEIGMSYLGMKILYGLLNDRDDCLAERVFTPWPDFEKVLRDNKMPLYGIESRRPLGQFDIVGFCLAYELTYTNVLTILDLGGIPLLSAERTDRDPLVIAGGPACFNPEPMADVIDAFVIGDGEEATGEIIDTYRRLGGAGRPRRSELLRALARIPGVYVPSLYDVEYHGDQTVKAYRVRDAAAPAKIAKRVVADLNTAFYPTKQIVPCIQIVHDRIAIEIMRGCKHVCRFCHASATYRPWRERSKETVVRLAQEAYAATGYEEMSLLSLSTGDHSEIGEIIESLNAIFKGKGVSISVPSLRIEDMATKLPRLVSVVRKAGLTFAPEAGSDCLRRAMNKNIRVERLMAAAAEAYKLGWRRVKLYFMIGLPTETMADVAAIADMVFAIANLKKEIDGRPAQVSVSINAFVPKSHTPLQWEAMERMDVLAEKEALLKSRLKARMVELDIHSFRRSYLEGVCARGDRRLGKAILLAWQRGARFDSWNEHFRFDFWMDALAAAGIDGDFYVYRKRPTTEVLPWDIIDAGVPRQWLAQEARAVI